jgi:hypothetical protein
LPVGHDRRAGKLGWVVIDLDHEPVDNGRRHAQIAGLSAAVSGMLFGAEAWLIDTQTPAQDRYLPRLLVVNAVAAMVLTPMIVAVVLALPDLTTRLLRRLRTDKVIGRAARGKRLDTFARVLEGQLNRAPRLPAVLTAVYFPYVVVENRAQLSSAPLALLVIAVAIMQAALFFLGWTAMLQLWITARAIGRLLRRFPMRVQPRHPDGCGGLRMVGSLLSLGLGVAAVLGGAGLCIVLVLQGTPWPPAYRPEPYVLIGFYAVLLPSALLHLLWRPHRLMDRQREEFLKPVARAFSAAGFATRRSATDDRPQLDADSLWKIDRQFKLLDEACPVWPLRMRRLRSVVATAVLPVAISVATAIIPKLLTG